MKTAYYNAQVYTGKLPLAQAFIVEDGRFARVGTDEEILAQSVDARVDLCGAFVSSGFIDSHMHLLNYGQALSIAQLNKHTSSLEDMISCLAHTKPGSGGWILGRGWNQDLFSDVRRMPNRWDLDRVSTQFPVCATRACGHMLAVNSKAIEILGITGDTPQMEGGEIVFENGEPNGIFCDKAMSLVTCAFSAPDKDEVKAMLLTACKSLNAYGITSCHSDDYCVFQSLPWQVINDAYRELEAEGKLSVRVYEQANFNNVPALSEFVQSGGKTGAGTNFFRIGPLKLLGDGALGARTAFLSRPYADDPSTSGLGIFTAEEFDALIGYANEHDMQIAVHCIGDACLDLVLNSFEKALRAHPRQDHRHGIVHCQITRPDQLKRIAENNLHIYAQSIFLDYDIHIVEVRAGSDLAKTSYSWKTLMDMGVCVSNGSDCPVELPRALAGMQCAVTRQDLALCPPYLPHEAFSVQQAIDSFTKSGARAAFEEDIKGQILPGMLADFVVLGENPFEISPEKIKDIPVLRTFVGGKEVYAR